MWLLLVILKFLIYWDFDYFNLFSDYMLDLYLYGLFFKILGYMLLVIFGIWEEMICFWDSKYINWWFRENV